MDGGLRQGDTPSVNSWPLDHYSMKNAKKTSRILLFQNHEGGSLPNEKLWLTFSSTHRER